MGDAPGQLSAHDRLYLSNIERKRRERANIRRDIEATKARLEHSTSEGEKTFLRTKLGALRRALIQRG